MKKIFFNNHKTLPVLFVLVLCIQVRGQEISSEFRKLAPFIQSLHNFSNFIPQEKVYLHFDNTSYYQGDHIWFKCYVVTSGQHQLSRLSKTLYVELLNPGGEIIDKRILKIEDGQCHGDFVLNRIPFYSGFYEVRAYTKYMLNWGEDIVFSRLLAVFNKPKVEGAFETKEMMNYGRWGAGNFPMKRERPESGKAVNLRFFPEGGNLIQGVVSRIAFEATDEFGNPIDVSGAVLDAEKQELSQITTLHEGKGVFAYTPGAGSGKDIAIVDYEGKKYQFDLPTGLPQGVVMEIDNLSHPDSLGVTLRKNEVTPAQLLGLIVMNGGLMRAYHFVNIVEDNVSFSMDKTDFPSGVSQIVLINGKGEVLCDRLIFTVGNDRLAIKAKTVKPTYHPFELVDLEIVITDREANPAPVTFSLSVRDGANEVVCNHNILTDLLLTSEIKGFVRNPAWYFEYEDDKRQAALDALLMVQGWRRYSWKQMAGIDPFDLKYLPEQGIETRGKVVSLVRQIPQPNVDVSLFMNQRGDEDNTGGGLINIFVTDSLGRFAFVSDVEGKWSTILSVAEKGKQKDHRILLDRIFGPVPKRYRYAELQTNIAEKNDKNNRTEDESDDDPDDGWESFFVTYQDSLAKLNMDEKVQLLDEVTVTAKRRTKAQDIYVKRSTSVAYYDVPSESDYIYDSGIFVGDDIDELLKRLNPDFSSKWIQDDDGNEVLSNKEVLSYKNKLPFFVINYEPSLTDDFYQSIRLNAIKSIYINEDLSMIFEYLDFTDSESMNPMASSLISLYNIYGCVVFIETYPDGKIPVEGAKGIRKTWLDGYSRVNEFYSPNYSTLPPVTDYRRTLYWNPSVATDETGSAKIQFYNNGSCKIFSISAETVTSQGTIGVSQEK